MHLIIITLILGILLPVTQQDDTRIGQLSRPFAEVSDPDLIDFFLDEFLIPESEVTKLEIIDVTSNGFGPDDIVVTYPSMRAYIVEEPSDAALRVMRNWSLDDFRIDSDNVDPDLFDPEISGSTNNPAQNAIIADMLRTLNRNYSQLPIRMRLERDENGFTFEMWDFDEGAMEYTPPSPVIPDSVFVYADNDTIYTHDERVEFADFDLPEPVGTEHPAQEHPRDSIYIYQTETDTIVLDQKMMEQLVNNDRIDLGTLEPEQPLEAAVEDPVQVDQPEQDHIAINRETIIPYVFDMARAQHSIPDTIHIPGLNLYDIIYISKTVSDTVFIPETSTSSRNRAGNR